MEENNNNSGGSDTAINPSAPHVESQAEEAPAAVNRKETREIVTPYAFFVADDLLGTRLAGPLRRGVALSIDLVLVTLLTQVSSLILATVAAFTFFRAGNRLATKKRFNGIRIFLRLLVAILLFVVVIGVVDEINNEDKPIVPVINGEGDEIAGVDGLTVVAIVGKYLLKSTELKKQISEDTCKPAYDCINTLGEALVEDVIEVGLSQDDLAEVIESYIDAMSDSMSTEDKQRLNTHLEQFAKSKSESPSEVIPVPQSEVSPQNSFSPEDHIPPDVKEMIEKYSDNDNSEPKGKGIVHWLKTLVEELGLGFGWAAFYFSIFTAWWKGQTPGKKLLGIKVLKLDGSGLNLWESFGRYGGYGAGLATGLLGFLQIFWDPNRQAIQDKISETLVVDLRHPKVEFVQTTVEKG